MFCSLPLISWGALTGEIPVIAVGMAAQKQGKKARIYSVQGRLWTAGCRLFRLQTERCLSLEQLEKSCSSLSCPSWAVEHRPLAFNEVTDCKITIIEEVQEHFNSCLFLVDTGSTGTDLYPCCSQPWCLLFCVVLGHLQPVTRL